MKQKYIDATSSDCFIINDLHATAPKIYFSNIAYFLFYLISSIWRILEKVVWYKRFFFLKKPHSIWSTCYHSSVLINNSGGIRTWRMLRLEFIFFKLLQPHSITWQYFPAQVLLNEWDKSTNINLAIMAGSPILCLKSSRPIKFYCLFVVTILYIKAFLSAYRSRFRAKFVQRI